MSDKPILFSAPMVRAIMREIDQPGTGKTQTRRVLSNDKPNSLFNGQWADSYVLDPGNQSWRDDELRYAVDDRLYVREAWRTWAQYDDCPPRSLVAGTHLAYEATPDAPNLGNNGGKLRPGMFLPRWASRITLIVTDVRVQRLQEISEADAEGEGWPPPDERATTGIAEIKDAYPIGWFAWLWDSLNSDRGYGWDANPWVAAYTFRPILGNIDQIGGDA